MELFKIFGSIIVDDEKALASLKKTDQEAYKVSNALNKINDTGKKISEVGKSLTPKLTLPIVALGGASFKMAADMQDSVGAVEKVFDNSSTSILNWAKQLPAYFGISNAQALEQASIMGSMLKNIGGQTEEVAAQQTQTLIQLAGDLSAMYGGSTEDALNSITSALSGNNQAMKKYGTAVLDADVKQKAFELGLYSGTGAMSAQAKQAGTLAIIMDQTSDAQGQAARESDQASGSMKEFATTIKNLSTDIGEVLLPIVTPMIQKVSEGIQKFSDLDDKTKKIIVVVALLLAGLGPLLMIVGSAISLFASLSVIAGTLGITVGALVAPILLVIAAVVAIIAIGVALWKNWDKIKEVASNLWQGIKDTFGKIGSFIGDIMSGAWQTVKNAIDKIKGFFSFKWAFPKLKMPHFKVSGSINPLNWLKDGVPKIGVEWYAKGGIMTRPTAFGMNGNTVMAGGEAGSEAILPLNARNLGMIGQGIANTMNLSQPQAQETKPQPIVLQIDGKTFAQIIGDYTGDEGGLRIRKLERGLAT